MVGELIGAGASQEQTMIGETPNLTARLQALAAPGRHVDQSGDALAGGGLLELADVKPRRLRALPGPCPPGGSPTPAVE
jgi:class 3 adenylate cyclase